MNEQGFRAQIEQDGLEDFWWVSIDGKVRDLSMDLESIVHLAESMPEKKVYLDNIGNPNDRPNWIVLELERSEPIAKPPGPDLGSKEISRQVVGARSSRNTFAKYFLLCVIFVGFAVSIVATLHFFGVFPGGEEAKHAEFDKDQSQERPELLGKVEQQKTSNPSSVNEPFDNTSLEPYKQLDALEVKGNLFPVMLIPKGAIWSFYSKEAPVSERWNLFSFDDSSWRHGPAVLGARNRNIDTQVLKKGMAELVNTTYYRHTFVVHRDANASRLHIALMRDDGAVIYLNDKEILRTNMPKGPIDASTYASSTVAGDREEVFHFFSTSARRLRAGKNVIAVEVHQRKSGSGDIRFELVLGYEE